MPDIGDFDEVAVIELLVKVGDKVAVEQSLITVESDKASMEIPSSQAGVVKELRVKVGDKVAKGSIVVVLEGAGGGCCSARAIGCRRAGQRCGSRLRHRPSRLHQRQPPPRLQARRLTSRRLQPVVARCHMPRRRSASWRVSSAFRSVRSKAAARKAASPTTTCPDSSSR